MPIVREPVRLPYYRSETPNRVGGQAPIIVTPELLADDPALLTPELADWWASVLPTLGDYAALISGWTRAGATRSPGRSATSTTPSWRATSTS